MIFINENDGRFGGVAALLEGFVASWMRVLRTGSLITRMAVRINLPEGHTGFHTWDSSPATARRPADLLDLLLWHPISTDLILHRRCIHDQTRVLLRPW